MPAGTRRLVGQLRLDAVRVPCAGVPEIVPVFPLPPSPTAEIHDHDSTGRQDVLGLTSPHESHPDILSPARNAWRFLSLVKRWTLTAKTFRQREAIDVFHAELGSSAVTRSKIRQTFGDMTSR
jgi:hypothetical protein